MQAVERAELIRRYGEGPHVLEAAIAWLSDADLDRRPEDGGWTAREVVHHVADSEMTSAIRLRRLLAEHDPVIQGYDEVEFARRLHYSERPLSPSLSAVRAARETTASILERMTEEEWRRSGTHAERGPYSVEDWLAIYSTHCHDHAEQIRRVVEARPSRSG
jgi:DinB superfamily